MLGHSTQRGIVMPRHVALCSTCVRNIASPVVPSEGGRCSYCESFDKHRGKLMASIGKRAGEFHAKTAERRGALDYDCLVMVSGGKDSVMALEKVCKETPLRPLAFTIDNGFEMERAMSNVERAADRLGVDWMVQRPAVLRKVICAVLKERVAVSVCRFCAPVMVNLAVKLAASLKIPYLVTGWNKGQSDREPSRRPLWEPGDGCLDDLISRYPFMAHCGIRPRENEKLLEQHQIEILSPWVSEARDPLGIMERLREDLGWEAPDVSYPKSSTSCELNLLQVLLSRKHFNLTHYDCEESMLVSFGEKSRAQAIETLDHDIDLPTVRRVLQKLGLSLAEVGLSEQELPDLARFGAAEPA